MKKAAKEIEMNKADKELMAEALQVEDKFRGLETIRKTDGNELSRAEFLNLYPGFRNEVKRARARELFFLKNEPLSECARLLDISKSTVYAWAYVYGWVEHKAREIAVRQKEEALQLAVLRAEKRSRILLKQLQTSEQIREKATELIEEADTAGQLKVLAEAAKSAADVETRALGVADNGVVADTAAEEQEQAAKANGKAPLVIVFNNNPSGLPPLRASGSYVVDAE